MRVLHLLLLLSLLLWNVDAFFIHQRHQHPRPNPPPLHNNFRSGPWRENQHVPPPPPNYRNTRWQHDTQSNRGNVNHQPQITNRHGESNWNGDATGRSRTHPKQIPRFSKYFPAPPKCTYIWPENPLQRRSPDDKLPPPRVSLPPAVDAKTKGKDDSIPGDEKDKEHEDKEDRMMKSTFPPPECSRDVNYNLNGRDLLLTTLNYGCPNMTWEDALDFCQLAGFRAVSFDSSRTEEEIEDVMELLSEPGLGMDTFWVAGYIDHPEDKSHPIQLKWVATRMGPEWEEVVPGTEHWSNLGRDSQPQPDNYVYRKENGDKENCLAVKLLIGQEAWHDLSCGEKHPVICELDDI